MLLYLLIFCERIHWLWYSSISLSSWTISCCHLFCSNLSNNLISNIMSCPQFIAACINQGKRFATFALSIFEHIQKDLFITIYHLLLYDLICFYMYCIILTKEQQNHWQCWIYDAYKFTLLLNFHLIIHGILNISFLGHSSRYPYYNLLSGIFP